MIDDSSIHQEDMMFDENNIGNVNNTRYNTFSLLDSSNDVLWL